MLTFEMGLFLFCRRSTPIMAQPALVLDEYLQEEQQTLRNVTFTREDNVLHARLDQMCCFFLLSVKMPFS